MAKVFIDEDTLTAIGDAIRERTGGTDKLSPAAMQEQIKALSTEDQLKAGECPDYVHPEVLEIANKVNAVRADDSIVFIAMSDTHYPAEQSATTAYASNVKSSVLANRAVKALAYLLKPDFIAHLGDVSAGATTTTPDMLKTQIEGFLAWLQEARSDLPVFLAIGNHDTGIVYHNAVADGNVYTMTGDYLYKHFTSHSASDDTVFGGEENGGYCYRDFADKKLRVFLLNTSEKLVAVQSDQTTYGSQRVWLANALLDLNAKSDATDWSFIILSHYPADYGGTMPLSELLKAYVEGASFTITDHVTSYYVGDGTSQAVDFSGKNGAKFIAQFHGHVHNFLTSKLYSYASGSGVQYDARRVCIPNGQFDRENYYSTVGSYTDISFAENTSYSKTADTANGTSFVVNVINPSEYKIYSFCFGAGYDRVIGYAATVYYSISATLTNVTSSNDALSIEEWAAYTATITAADGYEFKSVTVTMGGEDVTSAVYSDGVISIPEVTGNITITATAVEVLNVTNQLPIATDTDGSVYNGVGYQANTYLSSGSVGTKSGYYTTGFIPIAPGGTLYFKNCTIPNSNGYQRFALYDASKTFLSNRQYSTSVPGNMTFTFDSNDNAVSVTVADVVYHTDVAYIRFCCSGLDETSVVTVNEPID